MLDLGYIFYWGSYGNAKSPCSILFPGDMRSFAELD